MISDILIPMKYETHEIINSLGTPGYTKNSHYVLLSFLIKHILYLAASVTA